MHASGWATLAALDGIKFLFVDGPNELGDGTFGWGVQGPSDGFEERLVASVSFARHAVRDCSHSPVHGIGGFSSGALVAAMVAARWPGAHELQFFLNFSGAPWEWLPWSLRGPCEQPDSETALEWRDSWRHLDTIGRLKQERSRIGVISLHAFDEANDDVYSAEQLRSLPRRFHASQVVLAHGEGHGVPWLHKRGFLPPTHRLLCARRRPPAAAPTRCSP